MAISIAKSLESLSPPSFEFGHALILMKIRFPKLIFGSLQVVTFPENDIAI